MRFSETRKTRFQTASVCLYLCRMETVLFVARFFVETGYGLRDCHFRFRKGSITYHCR